MNPIHDSLRLEGFAVVRNVISRSEASDFVAAAQAVFAEQSCGEKEGTNLRPGAPQLFDAFERRIPDRYLLLTSPKIRTVVRSLIGDEPVLVSEAIPFQRSPAYDFGVRSGAGDLRNAHLHDLFFIEPEHSALIGWLALEDIRPEAGPMWVWPRSHLLYRQLYDQLLKADDMLRRDLTLLRERGGTIEAWNAWARRLQQATTAFLEREMVEQRPRCIPIVINACDLLLFQRRLVHGTASPANPDISRWSMTARYQGRGTIERGWGTKLGSSVYEVARRTLPPVRYEITRHSPAHAWRAVNPRRDARSMFWDAPLAG